MNKTGHNGWIRKGCCIIFCLAFVFVLGASYVSYAADPPEGSYKKTCKDIFYNSNTNRITSAFCKKMNGKLNTTYLDNVSGCVNQGGDISNCDGTLQCTGVNLPAGSYNKTCWCCRMVGSSMGCYCKPMQGKEKWTTLNNANDCVNQGGDISNCDGTLRCTGVNLPNVGSYQKSCWCCRMEGDTLGCYCKPKRGKEKWTTLGNATSYSTDIWNDNGTLKGR